MITTTTAATTTAATTTAVRHQSRLPFAALPALTGRRADNLPVADLVRTHNPMPTQAAVPTQAVESPGPCCWSPPV